MDGAEDVERLLSNVRLKDISVEFEMEESNPDPQTLAEKLIILIIQTDLFRREIPRIFRRALLEIPFGITFRRSEGGITFIESNPDGKGFLSELDGPAVRSDKTHPFAKSGKVAKGHRPDLSEDDY